MIGLLDGTRVDDGSNAKEEKRRMMRNYVPASPRWYVRPQWRRGLLQNLSASVAVVGGAACLFSRVNFLRQT